MLPEEGDANDFAVWQWNRLQRVQFDYVPESDLLRRQFQRNVCIEQAERLGNNQRAQAMAQPQQRFTDKVIMVPMCNQGKVDVLRQLIIGNAFESARWWNCSDPWVRHNADSIPFHQHTCMSKIPDARSAFFPALRLINGRLRE